MTLEIIIPAYNCTKTLHRTLSSLECQTDTNFLIHLIDDCSTEDYSSIIEMHKKLNIKITRNEKNLGCGMTRQVGIDATISDYIAFLDSDDVLMPYTVETWRKMAESSPDIDIFHSYFYEQKENEIILHKQGFTYCHGKLYKVSFIREWGICNSPEVRWADDSFFNSMCTELGKMAKIPIAMYMWLNNSESITRSEKIKSQNTILDFIHAMKLAVKFLKNNGVNEIKHMENTLKHIEQFKNSFNKETLKEYKKLMTLINGGD